MYVPQRNALLAQLEAAEQLASVENASAIGRSRLSVPPSPPEFRLSDLEVAVAFQHRCLVPPQTPGCKHCDCAGPSVHHAESCNGTKGPRVGRHGSIQYTLGQALATTSASIVEYEPLILQRSPGSPRYNKVRFSGSVPAEIPPMELDIKVLGLGTGRATTLAPSATRQRHGNLASQASARANLALAQRARTVTDHLPDGAILTPWATFHPFVLLSGRLAEQPTLDVLRTPTANAPSGSIAA